MSFLGYAVVVAASGMVVGALARLALLGKDPMSLLETMLVGIAGSFLAGIIAHLLFGAAGGSIALSVLVATGIVYWMRRRRGGEPVRPFGPHR